MYVRDKDIDAFAYHDAQGFKAVMHGIHDFQAKLSPRYEGPHPFQIEDFIIDD